MNFECGYSLVDVYDSYGRHCGKIKIKHYGTYSVSDSNGQRVFSLDSLGFEIDGTEITTDGNGLSSCVDVHVYKKPKDGTEERIESKSRMFEGSENPSYICTDNSYLTGLGLYYDEQTVYNFIIDNIDFKVNSEPECDYIIKIQPHIVGEGYPFGINHMYPFQNAQNSNLNYFGEIWEYKLTSQGGPLAPEIVSITYPSTESPNTCSITWKQSEDTAENVTMPYTTVIKRYEVHDPENTEVTIWRYAINGYPTEDFPIISEEKTGDNIVNEHIPVDTWEESDPYPITITDESLEPNKAYKYIIKCGNANGTAEKHTDSIIYTEPEDMNFNATLYSKNGSIQTTSVIDPCIFQYKIKDNTEWIEVKTLSEIQKMNAQDVVFVRAKNKILQGDGETEIYSTNWSNIVMAQNIYVPWINVSYSFKKE